MTRAPVDLEPQLLEVLDVGARLGLAAGVQRAHRTVAPATVRGDATALRRALLNLVENAIKYTPPGGKVELGLATGNGMAVVTVSDTGIGLDPADADRIFEPFVRLDAARARDTGGAGLGLAIARSIAVAHGGRLSVESGPARAVASSSASRSPPPPKRILIWASPGSHPAGLWLHQPVRSCERRRRP